MKQAPFIYIIYFIYCLVIHSFNYLSVGKVIFERYVHVVVHFLTVGVSMEIKKLTSPIGTRELTDVGDM